MAYSKNLKSSASLASCWTSRTVWLSAPSRRAFRSRSSLRARQSASHFWMGCSRVSQRLATPPPKTRDTKSSTFANRSTRTSSPKSSRMSHTCLASEHPCHAIRSSMPNSSINWAARAARQASTTNCSSRGRRGYLASTYSWSTPSKLLISVMKAITVCMPFTSENLRSERYSASRVDLGNVATDRAKGTRFSSPASRGTMDPRHGSASMSTLLGRMVRPMHTRSTMQSTTRHLSANFFLSFITAAWSFSQQKSRGWSSGGHLGRLSRRGLITGTMALPREQLKLVARSTRAPRSPGPDPKTRACGGMNSGRPPPASPPSSEPTDAALMISTCVTTGLPSTLKSMVDLSPDAKTSCHRRLGRCTTAKGMPDAAIAGTTRPMPRRPAPKWTW
mmetsp:Transcript_66808/g.150907  ORF Transcript_66808/g.150907 Transcript_66808/m.150907 type:complete len:391 (+) Transcript_66808:793-1965(+)